MSEAGPGIREATVDAGGAEGTDKKPVSELSVVSTESTQPKTGLLEILKRLIRKKPAESAEIDIDPQAKIGQIRSEILGAIAQRRSETKSGENTLEPFDSKAEESALNQIRQLGGELSNEEFHRLAILITIREKPQGAELTEQMVAETEKRLREEPGSQQLQKAA